MNKELLNKIKNMIIETANENGDDLNEQFESKDAFKQFVISFAIRGCMENLSMEIEEAFDFVLGKGSYSGMRQRVWESLTA